MIGAIKKWWEKAQYVLPEQLDLGKVWLVGAVLALVVSWSRNGSIVMALFHGMMSWLYILYYILCNG